jgi:hypothetical protein
MTHKPLLYILFLIGIIVIFFIIIHPSTHILTYQYTINGTVENKSDTINDGFDDMCSVTIKNQKYYVHEPLCSNLTIGENASLIITTFNKTVANQP